MTATTTIPTAEPTRSPAPAEETGVTATVLLVDETGFADEARAALQSAGYDVATCRPDEPALVAFSRVRPDVVVAAVTGERPAAFDLLRDLRAARPGRTVPVLLLTSGDEDEVLTGLELGADDCVRTPVSGAELAARVRAKTARPPVPAQLVSRDLRTGLLSEGSMLDEAGRELERGRRVSRSGGFAVVQIQEMPRLQERFGGGTATQIATQVTDLLSDEPGPLVRVGLDRAGRLLVLMPETAPHVVRRQLGDLARRIAATRFALGNEDTVRVTPVTGWVSFSGAGSGEELLDRAPDRDPGRPATTSTCCRSSGPRPSTPSRRSRRSHAGWPRSWTGCGCRASSWPPWCWASACRSWCTSCWAASAGTCPASPTGWSWPRWWSPPPRSGSRASTPSTRRVRRRSRVRRTPPRRR